MNIECNWKNPYTDSGDRGAARVDHDREFHPDHAHAWGDSSYKWEQIGETYVIPGSGGVIALREVTAHRCTVCRVSEENNREGQCV